MDRILALKAADELVSTWMEQVKNARGYVHDAWKPADPEARTDAVLRIAEFLTQPESRVVPPIDLSHWRTAKQLCSECLQPVDESPNEGCMDQGQHAVPYAGP